MSMSFWTRSSWSVKLALRQMGLKFGREFWGRTDIWEACEILGCECVCVYSRRRGVRIKPGRGGDL